MNVKELIAKLKKLPQDAMVCREDHEWGNLPINQVCGDSIREVRVSMSETKTVRAVVIR